MASHCFSKILTLFPIPCHKQSSTWEQSTNLRRVLAQQENCRKVWKIKEAASEEREKEKGVNFL